MNRASGKCRNPLGTVPADRAHIRCRRSYCKAENIECHNVIPSLQQPQNKRNVRSEQNFNFQEHCLFCGQPAETDKKNSRGEIDVYTVRSGDFHDSTDATLSRWGGLCASVTLKTTSGNYTPGMFYQGRQFLG